MRALAVGAVLVMTGLAGQASAAVITRTYSFADPAGPTGSVTVSFDPAVSALNRPGATLSGDLPTDTPVTFSYRRGDGTLWIVGAAANPGGSDLFSLVVHDAASDRALLDGELSTAAADGQTVATRPVIVTRKAATRLPEPATWTVLVLGFGLIGYLARYRQRRSEAAFSERMRRIAAGEIE